MHWEIKNLCDSAICFIWWSGAETTGSQSYACIQERFLDKSKFCVSPDSILHRKSSIHKWKVRRAMKVRCSDTAHPKMQESKTPLELSFVHGLCLFSVSEPGERQLTSTQDECFMANWLKGQKQKKNKGKEAKSLTEHFYARSCMFAISS